MVAWTSLLLLEKGCPPYGHDGPHQEVELVTGSYGTRCNAELARGVLDFDPWPAYVPATSIGETKWAHNLARVCRSVM